MHMSTVTINSTRFGALEIPADAIIEFPAGLIGLGGRRYALIATDANAPFHWLQSVEDADLALPVTDPWRFFADYEVELSDEETARIGLEDAEGVAVWVTVRASGELSEFTANLRAPILVNEGRGHQVINAFASAPLRARLFPEAPAQQAA
jgi:flagellar assembly factor FliW